MKHWNDLHPVEQGEYVKGLIRIHGFNWKCYWKFISKESNTIQFYSEYGDWCESIGNYSDLNNVFDWGTDYEN